jgi:hypothetical protein
VIERGSGEWPVNDPVDLDALGSREPTEDELYVKRVAELARRELVLGSIRANLLEQPTANSVLAVTRHWISDITSIGDEIAKTKRRSTG